MAAPAPDISTLPQTIQIAIYIGVGLAALGLALFGYYRNGSKPPTDDIVITSANIADMRPTRDLLDAVRVAIPIFERIAVAIEKHPPDRLYDAAEKLSEAADAIRELQEREAHEEDRSRMIREAVARGVEEELARRGIAPRAPRGRTQP